mmetsp:Transcript_15908/g.42056  ORF Transcript_15908/g.42056 Transcript_15908/m.42056 type:complete len:314 (-) Transcript_15908:3-944(-)
MPCSMPCSKAAAKDTVCRGLCDSGAARPLSRLGPHGGRPSGAAGGRLPLPDAGQVHVDGHRAGRPLLLRPLVVRLGLVGCRPSARRAALARRYFAASFVRGRAGGDEPRRKPPRRLRGSDGPRRRRAWRSRDWRRPNLGRASGDSPVRETQDIATKGPPPALSRHAGHGVPGRSASGGDGHHHAALRHQRSGGAGAEEAWRLLGTVEKTIHGRLAEHRRVAERSEVAGPGVEEAVHGRLAALARPLPRRGRVLDLDLHRRLLHACVVRGLCAAAARQAGERREPDHGRHRVVDGRGWEACADARCGSCHLSLP